MELCARCHKRPAVVYITRIEQDKTVNEGICIRCARELGIKPVDDIIRNMGLSEEDLDQLDSEMEGLVQNSEASPDDPDSRAPAIDFKRLFGNLPFGGIPVNPAFQQKNGANGQQAGGNAQAKGGKNAAPKKKFLDQYCLDLTKRAAEGKLDAIIGRNKELSRMIQILCRRQKNNPCLIGEPGVGKTAIAEALAQKIVKGDVPYKLKNKEVHLVDLTALVAGTQFRGQFESRIKGLIEEVKALGNIILVIDEVHSIVGAGEAEGSMNAANILKPALSRGEIQVIGATTLKEYRKYIEKDSALERRFQPIIIEESSVDDSIEILRGIKGYYEQFHGIRIPDETIRRIVTLSERYITDRFLPDKAIDLLDEASSHLALSSPVIEELYEMEKQMEAVKAEKDELQTKIENGGETSESEYARLAELKSQELQKLDAFNRLSALRDQICLDVDTLAEVIEIWTGVPASSITQHEYERIDGLEKRLKSRIIGQDKAVEAVTRAIKRNRAGIAYKRKPVSFIFAGPTGVGKTELVKTLAADLFDSPETLIRLDMSEFMEKHAVSRIIGAPPGYVGYDEAGQLTEKIRRKPYSVVLFDEIEKAHPDVLNILLQILDDGLVTDAQGRQVNFENTVIIMTTNAGSESSSGTAGFSADGQKQNEDKTEKALASFLRPEFLNRVDEVIVFRHLDESDFIAIASIMMNDLKKALSEREITLEYGEEVEKVIAEQSFSHKFGARNMRRYIQTNIEDLLAEALIASYGEPKKQIRLAVEDGKIVLA
ncbi:MAG: ATP-dependent Clp protease ATP-binding subunit [Ruminococcaceae bacterium]|nr:ATP-dependent Clp protease ATP-binding subunit [Oscillospiraceae bacterium]